MLSNSSQPLLPCSSPPLPRDQFAHITLKRTCLILEATVKCIICCQLQTDIQWPCGSVLTSQALAVPATTTTDYHPPFPLPSQTDNYATALNENERNYHSVLTVTVSDAESLEMETREQSTNKTWHCVRSQHLTLSLFSKVLFQGLQTSAA